MYRVPAGVDARFATVALRAAGGAGHGVRWYVDGRLQRAGRWTLAPGRHRVRAVDGTGRSVEVGIEVN